MATQAGQRLSPADTRRLIDDYTLYRFGYVLSPSEFAKQAGVAADTIDKLLAQKVISENDLRRIARSIDVSPQLLSEIAGYHDMSPDTRTTLNRFFSELARQPSQQRRASAA
jgi:hypothetical protein